MNLHLSKVPTSSGYECFVLINLFVIGSLDLIITVCNLGSLLAYCFQISLTYNLESTSLSDTLTIAIGFSHTHFGLLPDISQEVHQFDNLDYMLYSIVIIDHIYHRLMVMYLK